MQLEFVGKFVGMYVDPILDRIFPDETGAARLQQIGLFTLILVLEARGESVTAKRLSEVTGQHFSAIHLQMEKLLDAKVVGTRSVSNRIARGRAFEFFVVQNAKTKRLLKALDKAARKKR